MNFNRHRHIFSLGSLRKSKRWQPADLFESDPFKINSYSFRYAERPSLPMPVFRNRRTNNEPPKDCQTFFYNQDFSNTNNLNAVGNANDKRLMNLAKFQEYRRRHFLNEARSYRSCHLTGTEENSLNLAHDPCTSKVLNFNNDLENMNTTPSFIKEDISNINLSNNNPNYNTTQACTRSDLNPSSSKLPSTFKTYQEQQNLAQPSSPAICANNTRILGSGCEININIKGLENNSLNENINIKIETDSMGRHLNIPLTKTLKHSNLTTSRVEQLKSSNSFEINKRLSKFCSTQSIQNDVRKTEKERAKELTSIYSSQMLNTSPRERPTSLTPFKTNSFGASSSTFINRKMASKKSCIQRVRDNLSVYDNKATKKCYSRNNFNRSSYKLGYRESKASNCFSKKPFKSLASKRGNSKSTLGSTARLPLNININLFADKLKE